MSSAMRNGRKRAFHCGKSVSTPEKRSELGRTTELGRRPEPDSVPAESTNDDDDDDEDDMVGRGSVEVRWMMLAELRLITYQERRGQSKRDTNSVWGWRTARASELTPLPFVLRSARASDHLIDCARACL
jgi:hypothetical protein